MKNWTCDTCIHYPPSSTDGKPCAACNPDDPSQNSYTERAEKNYQYSLAVTEKQLTVLQVALEQFFRLQMGQFTDYCNDIAMDGYVYNKDDPDNSRKFNEFIERRDASRELFEQAFRVAQPRLCSKTPEMNVAIDMWSSIRHQRWLDRPEPKTRFTVDSREPYSWSGEPVMKIERIAE